MPRKKEERFAFSVQFGERDNDLLERLSKEFDVSKRAILSQGINLIAEIARLKAAGEKLLVQKGEERREIMLLFTL